MHAVTEQLVADKVEELAGSERRGAPTSKPSWWARRQQQVSKWDRPPDPHDWRYFVGMTGRVLITTGLLMFGFVAYQLWGTGIETARIQSKLENQFDAVIVANQVSSEEAETDVAADLEASADSVENSGPAEATSTPEAPEASAGETPAPNSDAAPTVVEQNLPPIVRGDAFARLEIPKIGKELYVLPGVDVSDLKKGPGHYPDTPLPGQLGNAAIAGHRTTWGEPFADLDQLAPGDEIIVTMANGETFVYDVTFTQIVTPADSWVIATTDPDVAMLTLTTCHPKYTTKQRMAVHSVLNPEKSAAVGVPTYYELEPTEVVPDNPDVAVVDDPVVTVAPINSAEVEASPADSVPSVSSSDPVVSIAEPAEPTEPTEPTEPADVTADAFARGWFHDRAAFPQIALWALGLIAIAILCRKISRKTRHDTIGIVITIAPFIVALYFFYQNVNRLLPPGL